MSCQIWAKVVIEKHNRKISFGIDTRKLLSISLNWNYLIKLFIKVSYKYDKSAHLYDIHKNIFFIVFVFNVKYNFCLVRMI